MKTKNIIALVAFFATFIFSAGLALYFTPIDVNQVIAVKLSKIDNRYARKISNVLRQDLDNAYDRQDYDDSGESIRISIYANKSAEIDVEGLPTDFQDAWSKHMMAWHNYSEFRKAWDSPKLRKSFDDTDLTRINAELNSKINITYYEVIRLARKYQAEIPKGAL